MNLLLAYSQIPLYKPSSNIFDNICVYIYNTHLRHSVDRSHRENKFCTFAIIIDWFAPPDSLFLFLLLNMYNLLFYIFTFSYLLYIYYIFFI